jgi:hypothetical protein
MANDIFECLIDDIMPENSETWPKVIWGTLQKLKAEETFLQSSTQHDELLNC